LEERQKHRGPGPKDGELFAPDCVPILREAVSHLSWLLTRGYPLEAALALVGNRFQLVQRQRIAVRRCACSDQQLALRLERRVPLDAILGKPLWIDGFNLLITLEGALGGAVLLKGRDHCLRDLAELRGSYRLVAETGEAISHLLRILRSNPPSQVRLYLDRPVSNSGRLKTWIQELAVDLPFPMEVRLVKDPDPLLIENPREGAVTATADSMVLDACGPWVDLFDGDQDFPSHWIVDLS